GGGRGRGPGGGALACAGLARWPELDRELEAPPGYRRGGGLRVALDDETWAAAPAWVAEQREAGVPVELVDAAGARALAPGLALSCRGGGHCAIDRQAGAMDPGPALATAARRLGARVEEGVGARGLVVERGHVLAVEREDGACEACDVTIVAAGAWSAALLSGVGVRLPLETRALQMILTDAAPATLRPVVGAFEHRLSLKQLASGGYLIGGGWAPPVSEQAADRAAGLDQSVKGSPATPR